TFEDLPTSFSDTIGKVLAGADMTTPEGWMNAETLSAVAPMGIIAVAVISMVRAVAGEEQDKTLGVLLSTPVSRTTFMLAKVTAMTVHALAVVAGLAIGMVAGSAIGDLGLTASGIVAACVHLGLLGLFFGGVAAVVGAATGDRRLSSAISAGLAVLAFVISAFAPLIDSIADAARISPWYYFAGKNPLVNGIDVSDAAVLAIGFVVLTTLSVLVHRRRDLRG
ncbi:MAG: ABC transporter permease, partial [Aeromicrobium sp.]|uniref:ABC transporter permease n=1 Tax=Aeromicrobium sp. TaxID=1871063 RepID=UPI003C64550F